MKQYLHELSVGDTFYHLGDKTKVYTVVKVDTKERHLITDLDGESVRHHFYWTSPMLVREQPTRIVFIKPTEQ